MGSCNACQMTDKTTDRMSERKNTMTDQWVSPRRAAEIIGVSERTIWRRVKTSELESRLTDQGAREILVGSPVTPSDNVSDSLSVIRDQAEREIQIAATTIDATRRLANVHLQELNRARRVGLAAWLITATLVVSIAAGGYFALRTLDTTERALDAERIHATDQAERLTDTTDRLTASEVDLKAERDKTSTLQDRIQDLQGDIVTAERARADAVTALADRKQQPPAWITWLQDLRTDKQ